MRTSALFLATAILLASCEGKLNRGGGPGSSGGGGPGAGNVPGGPPPGPTPPPPYEALSPSAYASKIKDLMTGLPLSDAELAMVTGNHAGLRALIDTWMGTPQFKEKMFDFFKNAFQQTQLDITDLDEQLRLESANVPRADQAKMLTAVQDSFARTVQVLVDEGKPFTEVVTTKRFMLNVPLMVSLAFMDAAPRDDVARSVASGYWIVNKYGGTRTFKYTMVTNVDPATGVAVPIPFEESINPTHPNFMKFTFAQPDPARYMPCVEPVVVMGTRALDEVFSSMWGSRDSCQGSPAAPSLFTDADWNTWKMVTIRTPRDATEERTLFWDLPKMRDPAFTEMVLGTPRVGFMTTPAFFANWPTNPSNSYRVTTNQALIVALGRSFDDRSSTVQVVETNSDDLHIQPNTVCFGCHQTLDPMRDFFKQSYSLTYFQQLAAPTNRRNPIPATGTFAVDGHPPTTGRGVETFANAVAGHPAFAVAWTQKLCQMANASSCLYDDPELQRVAGLFRESNHNFKTLVREVYSSPLVTYAAKTQTAEVNGVTIGIARREQLCARLGNRFGIKDACNLKGESTLPAASARTARNLSFGIPGSSYARADEQPVMPHDPNLFFSSSSEKLCMMLAGQLIPSRWKGPTPDAALDELVSVVMGVPLSDERGPKLREVLLKHFYTAALELAGGNQRNAVNFATDALKSTFVLACTAPPAISTGL
jgi:hypothetical protein